jgi:hypothetical protein
MKWAINMFPPQLRPTVETQASYTVEWLEMVAEIGPDRFSLALVDAVRISDYFPVIAKIRQCAGVSSEQKKASEADAAWQYVLKYISKGYACDWYTNAPALPPRIDYAVRHIGGIHAVNNADDKALTFMRRDFCQAWERYQESSSALTDLLLDAPLEEKRLELGTGKKMEPKEKPIDVRSALLKLCRPITASIELTDADVEDRREMLRQQAEMLRNKA